MAERRMFCKSVVESDQFMGMPSDAQALYLHLNMAADDDGFVANPRTIMRACGAKDDSMKLLIARKFVLTFEKQDNFVVVIKHWRLNNYIQKDRYRETKYKEFMRELFYDENKSYSTNPNDGHYPCLPESSPSPVTKPSRNRIQTVSNTDTECIQPVSDLETQDRLGKDRLGKGSTGEERKEITTPSAPTERKEEEGESEGEQPPAAVSVCLSPEKRAERIAYFQNLLRVYNRFGYDTTGIYNMAAHDGITRDELEIIKEDEE